MARGLGAAWLLLRLSQGLVAPPRRCGTACRAGATRADSIEAAAGSRDVDSLEAAPSAAAKETAAVVRFCAAAGDLQLSAITVVIDRPATDLNLAKVYGRRVAIGGVAALQLTYKRRGACDVARNHYAKGSPQQLKAARKASDEDGPLAPKALCAVEALRFVLDGADRAKATVEAASNDATARVTELVLRGSELKTSSRVSRAVGEVAHDKVKRTAFSVEDAKWLHLVDITDENGATKRGREKKLTQVLRFAELVQHATAKAFPVPGKPGKGGNAANATLQKTRTHKIRVCDMGSGRGYLTFAAHAALERIYGAGNVETVGIELRRELVEEANANALKAGFPPDRLSFVAERIEDCSRPVDVLIALHACDTATDDALFAAVQQSARVVLAAPCCHKELRPFIDAFSRSNDAPASLRELNRHGILAARHSEAVTDALRVLLLEASGFDSAALFEFAGLEDTSRNSMISATKRPGAPVGDNADVLARVRAFASGNGISTQRLARLLGVDLGGDEATPIRTVPKRKPR
ncbi:methyltransferase domain-containing protein [Pelagophyceae sp. CCMP2097]|nr:methyltransferase domain-containing protein [Pelagophyceae sp. CCMP2097]